MTQLQQSPHLRSAAPTMPRLLGIGLATPPHLSQEMCAAMAEPLCCDDDQQRQFLRRIYTNCGVRSRGSVLFQQDDPGASSMQAFYRPRTSASDRGPGTADRMERFSHFAPGLALASATGALATSATRPDEITHLIPVTCTGFFSPGLDIHLINSLGLRPEVQRVQVGFMGCHGAFNAMATARHIVLANPRAKVLICCVELCSLHLAYGFHPQRLVANALFADGSASAVIGLDSSGSTPSTPAIADVSTLLIPSSLDAMTWRIGDHGFEMTLSPTVPALIRTHLPDCVNTLLAAHQLAVTDLQYLALHPGGPKVLTATTDALGVDPSMSAPSRQVLAEHGNMSSATILFVLQQLLQSGARGHCLALGFGPGLTAEAMLLEL